MSARYLKLICSALLSGFPRIILNATPPAIRILHGASTGGILRWLAVVGSEPPSAARQDDRAKGQQASKNDRGAR